MSFIFYIMNGGRGEVGMVALVVGATGLVGRMVTEELLGREELEEVRVLVRSLPDITHPQLKPILVEWDQLDRYSEAFSGVQRVLRLGTTIRKAGSQQFRKVDVDYVIKTAELAKRHG